MLKAPSDETLIIKTDRLILEPILVSHADEMLEVLSYPEMYKYIPENPPTLDKLRIRYEHWAKRISPKGDELWLNWVGRRRDTNQLIGFFQSGFRAVDEIDVAYVLGINHQKLGFAYEAMSAIILFLKTELNAKIIKAWIDTRNEASIKLVKKLNMKQVEFIKNADFFKEESSDEFIFELRL
jgi:RimJ/RimL family protein N-acetyltransferase